MLKYREAYFEACQVMINESAHCDKLKIIFKDDFKQVAVLEKRKSSNDEGKYFHTTSFD